MLIKKIIFLGICCLCFTGCGLKGDLYLPESNVEHQEIQNQENLTEKDADKVSSADE